MEQLKWIRSAAMCGPPLSQSASRFSFNSYQLREALIGIHISVNGKDMGRAVGSTSLCLWGFEEAQHTGIETHCDCTFGEELID
ncbi:hypothetical protein TNCV_4763281 [Trichonephila clavipes]|nr:hypothetical protein TNCV_4763281 [Trichonephila clavipes]